MDTGAGRDYDFWPISELPDIYLDPEFFMQTYNIMAIVHRHICIITRRNMRYELLRLLTFILYFPPNTRLDLRAFATAGFYYTRERDYVVCYRCGFCKRNWAEGDDPREIHQRYSPVCDFFHNRGVNIPFFRINEGGLRRLTETTTVNERISPGPTPVIPADEIQRRILRLLGRTYPEIHRRIVFSDRDYINAQPVVDLRQGRQLVENLNFVVNEISVTLSDLEINLRRDFLHSLTESESGVTLHSRPVRQNEHYQAIILGPSRMSNRSVTLEGVHTSTSVHSVHDLYTAEESEVQTEGRLLQEDNSDLYGVHSVERCFSYVSEQTDDCSRSENCIPYLRGLMTNELNQDQNISYDSIERREIAYSSETDQTRLKTLCEPEMNVNHSVINDHSEQPPDNVSVLASSNNKAEASIAAAPEDTCRKALCYPGNSTEKDNDEPGQRVFSNSTAEKGEFVEFYFPSPQEAETGKTSTPNTVVSDGKDSNNSQFKVLPRHNNEPRTATISSGAHDLTKDAAVVTTSSTDIKAKAVEGREKGYSSETEQTRLKTICEPVSSEHSEQTSDNVSLLASGNNKGEANIAAIPVDTCRKALDSPGDSTEKGNDESTQRVFSNLAKRGEIPKFYYPSPQEAETAGTATPQPVVSDGRDSNNAKFKVLPRPLMATISSEDQELKKDAADVIRSTVMTFKTEQKCVTDASDKKRQNMKRDTCSIDNGTISNMDVTRTTAGDGGFSSNKRIEHNEKRVNCYADIDLNGSVATHNNEQTAIKFHETLPMNADIPEGKKISTVPFCPDFDIPDFPEKDQETSGFNAEVEPMEKNMPQEERSLTEKREQKGLTDHNISEEGSQRIGTVVKEEDFSNESQPAILHPSDHVDKRVKEKHSFPRPSSDSEFFNLKTGQTSGISLDRCRHASANSALNKGRNMLATPFQDVSPAYWKVETDRSHTILLRNKKIGVAAYSNEDIYLKQMSRIRDKPIAMPAQYFGKICDYPDGNTKADDNDIAYDMRKNGFFSRKVLQKEELCSKSQESLGDESEESFGDESEQCSITEKINAQLCQQKKSSTSKTASSEWEGSGENSDMAVDVSFNLAREQFNKIKDPRRKNFALTQFLKAISEAHTLEFTDTSN